jgi:hypothetical protein
LNYTKKGNLSLLPFFSCCVMELATTPPPTDTELLPSLGGEISLLEDGKHVGNEDGKKKRKGGGGGPSPKRQVKGGKRVGVGVRKEEKDGEMVEVPMDLFKAPKKSRAEVEEEQGLIEFMVIRNDGSEKSLCQLLKLKVR